MSFSYNAVRTIPMSDLLQLIHEQTKNYVDKIKKQQQAKELEIILREIKNVAYNMGTGKNKHPVITQYAIQQYEQLINDAFLLQNSQRADSNINTLKSASSLFTRKYRQKNNQGQWIGVQSIADDIFEEELASIFAALDINEGIPSFPKTYIIGRQRGATQAMLDVSKGTQKAAIQLAKKAGQKWIKNPVDINLPTQRSLKADLQGVSAQIDINLDPNNLFHKLRKLTAGKTFSLKNRSAFNQTDLDTKTIFYSQKKIGLGDTNIYKSLTGGLGLVMDGKASNRVFFRGMQIMAGETKNPPTATCDQVAYHFAHLRFIYELAGSGLIDTTNNNPLKLVDYIIYNDPSSPNIGVRDTGSLIAEILDKNNRTNLFSGEVEISASQLFSTPVVSSR